MRSKVVRICFLVVLAGVLYATLSNTSSGALSINDKVAHALAFLLLGYLGLIGWSKSRIVLVIGLLFLGAGIELLQATPLVRRDAEFLDWAADAVGIAAAWIVAWKWSAPP